MPYPSIDKVQTILAEEVFGYAKDKKKAAGRALGTFIEIINFYLLKTWDLEHSISIERGLSEYGNTEITHNVEYSLHPIFSENQVVLENDNKTITANKIISQLRKDGFDISTFSKTSNAILKDNILRNACTIASNSTNYLVAYLNSIDNDMVLIDVLEQYKLPYAIFECKRVGVEEGMKKGPQTIEKAKQGAYVAKSVSSLQKIRTETGELNGIIYESDNSFKIKPYHNLVEEIVISNNAELLRRFVLTVGMVSNHGNWFTSENQNKELKVLAQSYDWLLFLTDNGLATFIEDLLLHPAKEYECIKAAFMTSYNDEKVKNQFTKVQMNMEANNALQKYFSKNQSEINNWFNVISPKNQMLSDLKKQLNELKSKNWQNITNLFLWKGFSIRYYECRKKYKYTKSSLGNATQVC